MLELVNNGQDIKVLKSYVAYDRHRSEIVTTSKTYHPNFKIFEINASFQHATINNIETTEPFLVLDFLEIEKDQLTGRSYRNECFLEPRSKPIGLDWFEEVMKKFPRNKKY